MYVGGNKRVLSLCGVNVRNGILKYEAGVRGGGNISVRRFGQAVFNRPNTGTACVLFEGEHFVKLSTILFRQSEVKTVKNVFQIRY